MSWSESLKITTCIHMGGLYLLSFTWLCRPTISSCYLSFSLQLNKYFKSADVTDGVNLVYRTLFDCPDRFPLNFQFFFFMNQVNVFIRLSLSISFWLRLFLLVLAVSSCKAYGDQDPVLRDPYGPQDLPRRSRLYSLYQQQWLVDSQH